MALLRGEQLLDKGPLRGVAVEAKREQPLVLDLVRVG